MSGSYRVPPAARAGSGARPTSGWQLLLIGALVFAGAWAGIMITHEADRVAPIWITNAVLLAVLLRSSAHRWPLVLAVGCIANALANITTGDAAVTALGLSACNTLEIVTAALLLARPAGSPLDLRRSA
ncbi:MASE1 domain-containing protein, partial [Skermanella aerolata]